MKKERPVEEPIRIPSEEKKKLAKPTVFDPMGSYTGRPAEKWEIPVQDADDL